MKILQLGNWYVILWAHKDLIFVQCIPDDIDKNKKQILLFPYKDFKKNPNPRRQ